MFKKGKRLILLAVLLSNLLWVGQLLAQGEVSFLARKDYAAGTRPRSITTADFNGDAILDLAVAAPDSSGISILLGNEDGTFQAARYMGALGLNRPWSIVAVGFDSSRYPYLAVSDAGSNMIRVFRSHGDGTFEHLQNSKD